MPAEVAEHSPIGSGRSPENPFAHMGTVLLTANRWHRDLFIVPHIRLYEELPVVILPVDHVLTVPGVRCPWRSLRRVPAATGLPIFPTRGSIPRLA